jgi:hypothetical protein
VESHRLRAHVTLRDELECLTILHDLTNPDTTLKINSTTIYCTLM